MDSTIAGAERTCWAATTEWFSNAGNSVSEFCGKSCECIGNVWSDTLRPGLEKIVDALVDAWKWVVNLAESHPEACITGAIGVGVGVGIMGVVGYFKNWFVTPEGPTGKNEEAPANTGKPPTATSKKEEAATNTGKTPTATSKKEEAATSTTTPSAVNNQASASVNANTATIAAAGGQKAKAKSSN